MIGDKPKSAERHWTRSKQWKKRKRRLYDIFLTSSATVLLLAWNSQLSCVIGAMIQTPSGLIKQHRVKASKRQIDYGIDHPWNVTSIGAPLVQTNGNKLNARRRDEIAYGSEQVSEITPDRSSLNDDNQTKNNIKGDELFVGWSTQTNIESNDPTSIYQPIRIQAHLVNHQSSGYHLLTLEQREALLDIITPSLNNWSNALSVPRIEGNLTIDREQLYDGISCGPGIDSAEPSVVVPEKHFTIGETGVDLMVYVSVSFQENVLMKEKEKGQNSKMGSKIHPSSARLSHSSTKGAPYEWGDFTNYTGPSEFFRTEKPLVLQNSASIENATLSPSQSPSSQCSGSYLASATYCSTDQFDRPIAGLLHLCIGPDFFQSSSLQLNHLTITHELGHILGFNSHSLAHFRDKETGIPLTERINGDVPDIHVECTGVKLGRSNATIPLPSDNILKFRDVRGIRVAEIVTPTVQQVVRNHFHCEHLNGAELESEIIHPINETTNSCIGEHWTRRLFKNDIMNPIVEATLPSSHFSPLTLAYFIDSGWYQVNSSRAYASNTWGRGAGCDFVNRPCLFGGGKVSIANARFFCNYRDGDDYDGCTDDATSKAICSTSEFDSSLPTEFQYFSEQNFGGFDMNLDYCPTFVGTPEGICSENANTAATKVTRLDSFGFSNSRCLSGKVGPLCVQVACAMESRSLHIKVDGFWKQCHYDGEVIRSWWDDNYVNCPDPLVICPTFHCPLDCLHGQHVSQCNFETGACSCLDGKTNRTMHNFTRNCGDEIYELSEHGLDHYITEPGVLKDDEKNILDHAARMFTQMSVAEVISFVACSLLVVVSCTIVLLYAVKFLGQRADLPSIFSRWLHRSGAWSADLTQWAYSHRVMRSDEGNEKDKMVASVLHNLRVENNAIGIVHDVDVHNENDDHNLHVDSPVDEAPHHDTLQQRTIYRSQLPPLPGIGVGRILSIPGFTYIDDSMLIGNEEDVLTAAEATAVGSRSSCQSSQLESCSIQSVLDESEIPETSTVRRRK